LEVLHEGFPNDVLMVERRWGLGEDENRLS
jgi:hypothetical protein